MMILKGCPRCKGDVYLQKDIEGSYLSCMQCGYMKDVGEEDPSIRVRVRIPEETGKQPIAS